LRTSSRTSSSLAALGLALLLSGCENEVPVLLYHWVGAGTGLAWDISPERFAAHLDELKALGFETVTLRELYDFQDGKGDLPRRPVVITFDDGDATLYRTALPLLRERGMRADVFLVESFIRDEPSDRFVWMRDEKPLPMLIWPEVVEMTRDGTFEVHSHSLTPPQLAYIPIEAAREEIMQSRQRLSQRLGWEVEFFAYPAHSLNGDVIQAVEDAGYRGAVAGANRLGGRFGMWRISVFANDAAPQLREKVAKGWADAYLE